jgi:hypothetical protein
MALEALAHHLSEKVQETAIEAWIDDAWSLSRSEFLSGLTELLSVVSACGVLELFSC